MTMPSNPKAEDESKSVEQILAEEEAVANAKAAEELSAQAQSDEDATSESAPEENTSKDESKKEEESEEDVDLSQLSAKAQKRFQKLSDRAKRAEELERENEELRRKAQPPKFETTPIKTPEVPQKTKLPWDIEDDGDEDIVLTPEQLKEQQRQTAREVLAEERQREAAERENEQLLSTFKSDAQAVESKYPELRVPTEENPNPDFDQELVSTIANLYRKAFAGDKRTRFSEFVENIMSLRKKGLEQGKAQAAKALNNQSGEQALPPSGSPSSKGGNIEDLIKNANSMEELEELEKSLPHA